MDNISSNLEKRTDNYTLRELLQKWLKKVYVGACVKMIKLLLFSKMNFRKLYKQRISIAKFGIMCGTIFLLFQTTRMLIRKLEIDITRESEVFISAMVSSLALFAADKGDIGIIKAIIYPRAAEAIYSLLKEKGLARPVKHGEGILFSLVLFVASYSFILERFNLPPSILKTYEFYVGQTVGESYLREANF